MGGGNLIRRPGGETSARRSRNLGFFPIYARFVQADYLHSTV